jgi:hypothetical protein
MFFMDVRVQFPSPAQNKNDMITIVLLIGLCLATLIITVFFETAQDYWMSKDSKNVFLYKKKWKFWGQGVMYSYFVIGTIFDIYLTDWYGLFLFPIQGLIFWISHDAALGVRFGKGIYYLGANKWDTTMKELFYSGKTFFWVRVFLLAIITLVYLKFCCNIF